MKAENKIRKLDELKRAVTRLRRAGQKIAFTNGCFDILHFGHVHYLEAAKKKNRTLIVGLNSDASVKKIKGPLRPIVRQKQRATVLAALASVDFVTIFNEPTPLKTIQALKPDVLIKGADWKGKEVVGGDFVRSYGGKVEFIHYWSQFSTSNIIQSILEKCPR